MGDRLIAPSRFNKQCATVIAKYVESQDELMWERSGLSKVIFICKNKTNPICGGGSYLLCVAGSSNLFVHCDLTYTEPDHNTSVERKFVFQGISLQFYYGANYCFCRADWDLKDKNVCPACSVLQLLCYCAFVVILTYAAKLCLPGVSAGWLILPVIAASLHGNFALEAALVRKDKDLEMFCVIKFLILVPLAVYLLFRM